MNPVTPPPQTHLPRVHQKRVFETVKNINQTVRHRSPAPPLSNIPGSNQMLSPLNSAFSSGLATPLPSLGDSKISCTVALDNRTQSLLQEEAGESTPLRWVCIVCSIRVIMSSQIKSLFSGSGSGNTSGSDDRTGSGSDDQSKKPQNYDLFFVQHT